MKIRGLILALMSFTLAACGSSEDENDITYEYMQIEVSDERSFCDAFETSGTLCLLVKEENSDSFEGWDYSSLNFVASIGTSYVLDIEIATQKADPGLADGTDDIVTIRVVEVVSETTVDIGTKYIFEDIDLIYAVSGLQNSLGYSFFGLAFQCAENIDCEALEAMNEGGGMATLEFEYMGEDAEFPLELVRWN